MTNLEILNQIMIELEKNHINLYHDVTKQTIENFIKNVGDWNSLNSVEFDCNMKKLFALFRDAHTSYSVTGKNVVASKIYFIQNDFYVFYKDKYMKILKIGNLDKNEYYNQVKELINYETVEWLNYQVNMAVNNAYYHQMLGLLESDKLRVDLEDNEVVYLEIVDKEIFYKNQENEPVYYFKILDGNILYVKYAICMDDVNNPFSEFVNQINALIEKNNIKKYILDVRDNRGGNSEILNPFQNLVVEKKLKGCVLANNGTFSSGRFAVYRFKKFANAIIVGEPTGGKLCAYGEVKYLNVEDKRFACSTEFFDMSDVFGYSGAIKPDVCVPFTIHDLISGKDSQLEKAKNLLV